MNRQAFAFLTLILLAIGWIAMSATQTAADAKDEKLLRHVVLFKFKEDLNKEKVQEVVAAFGELPGKIEQIHEFEWGKDVSVENKSAGFTHCFFVTFKTTKGRDEYLPHPAHKEFVKLVGPRVDKVLVFDYWTGK